MKKTIYLTILSIITVLCIIFGSIYHLTGWFGSEDKWDWFHNRSFSNLDYSRVTYSEDLDSFDNLTIDTSAMDITIEIGDHYHLTYDCVAFLVPDAKAEDHTFTLTQPSIPRFGGSNNHCEMTLTIPSDAILGNAKITADIGNVTITNINSESVTLEADIGDVKINSCNFNNSDIETDIGTLKIENCNLGATEVSSDIGNISLTNCDFTNMELSNNMGNISLNTDLDLSDYNMDIYTDMGNLTINGEKQKKGFKQTAVDSSNGYQLIIENDAGNIEVNYH